MEDIKGISPTASYSGYAQLYECLFSWSETRFILEFPVILMGGWKDDVVCESTHHIQRIVIPYPPPLDIVRLLLPRKFPIESTSVLELRGFISNDATFKKVNWYINSSCRKEECSIDYPNKHKITAMLWAWEKEEKRPEKFDFIEAVWLWDGRIFTSNEKLIEKIIELARWAAIQSHEGVGPWRPLSSSE